MRRAVGGFGLLAATGTVWLVARHGYISADNELDGFMLAFFFAVIAMGGLGGHAVAVAVWRKNWAWGLIIGLVAAAALTVNLSNSLGAIAGRSDKVQAERTKARDQAQEDRRELQRLLAELGRLPSFVQTNASAVRAAEAAVQAAERARLAECEVRRALCRDREADERTARAVLATTVANRGLTEQEARLASSVELVRSRLEKAAPIANVNPQALALSRLFHVGMEDAATWQQLAMAGVVELLIVAALVAHELMEASGQRPGRPAELGAPFDPLDFLMENLRPSKRGRVEVGDLYAAYAAYCATKGAAAMEPEDFIRPLEEIQLPRQSKDGKVYLLNVQLAA